METNRINTTGPVGVGAWNVPDILRRLVSPLTLCGLGVVAFLFSGGFVLSSDLSEYPKVAGFFVALGGIFWCFYCAIRKVKGIVDLVADVDYHKQALITQFIEGDTLKDFVDDRIQEFNEPGEIERNVEQSLGELTRAKDFEPNGRNMDSTERRFGPADRRTGLEDRREGVGGRRETDVL